MKWAYSTAVALSWGGLLFFSAGCSKAKQLEKETTTLLAETARAAQTIKSIDEEIGVVSPAVRFGALGDLEGESVAVSEELQRLDRVLERWTNYAESTEALKKRFVEYRETYLEGRQ